MATIVSEGAAFVKHILFDELKGVLMSGVKEHGAKALRSFIGGLGTNDEALFQSAISYAVSKLGVSVQEINDIMEVINEHPEASSRIREIMGKDEQPTAIESPIINKDGNPMTDKSGKVVLTKTTVNMNVRGGDAIFVMSKMSKEQKVAYLKGTGGFDTMGHNMAERWTKLVKSAPVQAGATRAISMRTSINDWMQRNS